MRHRRIEHVVGSLSVLVLLCGAVRAAGAQSPAPSLAPDECYRFAFGTWKPPLPPIAPVSRSPDTTGRAGGSAGAADWAARLPTKAGADATPADSELVLFPGWWPAGIGITWSGARGDTLIGVARAFVADGRLPTPTAGARAIRIPCVRK